MRILLSSLSLLLLIGAAGTGDAAKFTSQRDLRKCMSPMCGGWFLEGWKRSQIRCVDGAVAKRCYVAEIDWSRVRGIPPKVLASLREGADAGRTLLTGRIVKKRYGGARTFGVLKLRHARALRATPAR